MYKFIYIDKETGEKIYSNTQLKGDNLDLVVSVKNVAMANNQVLTKTKKAKKTK